MAAKKPTTPPKAAAKPKPKAKPKPEVVEDLPTHPPEIEEEELVPDEPLPETPADPVPDAPGEAGPVDPNKPASVDKEKLLTFVEDIIDTLTFKRVALIALLTAVGLVMFSLYENRTGIFGAVTGPSAGTKIDEPLVNKWELSPASKASLEGLAKSTNVSFIIVSDVDLKKNRRAVRFYYLDDPAIVLEPGARQALALPLPVFDYDSKNTEQMVAVLSNEFRCDPFKETMYFRHAPELAETFPTICRIAIPPFVGQFVGFLTVGIRGKPTASELDQIRLEVSRIAVEIYLSDVMKKSAVPVK